MANPLSNPAGNVAPRWVYQAILVEMTDKTLYGLCATQRHEEIRGIFNSGIWPTLTPTLHWQFWVVMINGGESAYFQTDLLDFDAFLIIFHFVRDFLRCYTWFHPSPDRLGLAVDWGWLYTSSGQRTSKNLIFPLKFGLLVSLYLCNKHARFHWDIFQTGPVIKIWLLENCRWPWPRKHWCYNVQFTSKIVHSKYRHEMFARLIKKHSAVINRAVFNWKWVYSWWKGSGH